MYLPTYLKISPFCSVTSFSNLSDCSRDLMIFIISFDFSFVNINVVVADAATVNSKGAKTHLVNDLHKFAIKDKPVLIKGPKSLLKNPPNFNILEC